MRRIAPLLTLLAVVVLGGALYVVTSTSDPSGRAVPATVTAAAGGGVPAPAPAKNEISLADVPVAGDESVEISLADIPVVGAPVEVSIADLPGAPGGGAPAPAAPPAAGAAAEEGTAYAGRTGNWTVAVAVIGDRAVAYVCDGAKIEAWLEGPVGAGELSLISRSGKSTMSGTVTADSATGTVTVLGEERDFSADAVDVAAAVRDGRDDVGDVAERIGLETP